MNTKVRSDGQLEICRAFPRSLTSSLAGLVSKNSRSQRVITLFLATLELIKIQEVQWSQVRGFGEIYLNKLNMSKLAESEALLFVAGEEENYCQTNRRSSLITPNRCGAKFRKIIARRIQIPVCV